MIFGLFFVHKCIYTFYDAVCWWLDFGKQYLSIK